MMRSDQRPGSGRGARLAGSGFTLTELLVAMTIAGILSAAILALFNSTSNALYQADSLASVVDRARFALERMRTEVQAAGSFATPDSTNDPSVRPKKSNFQVAGLVSYTGWQDNTPSEIPGTNCRDSSGDKTSCSGAARRPSFDGFVVMGAFNYPVPFELKRLRGSGAGMEAIAVANRRGLLKLKHPDPFSRDEMVSLTSGNASDEFPTVIDDATSSIMRVLNPSSGAKQFAPIADVANTTGPEGNIGLSFSFDPGYEFQRQQGDSAGTQAGDLGGLDRASANFSKTYPGTALIDAYWYYVDGDPENPDNFQLLRQRIDAGALGRSMAAGGSGSGTSWSALSESSLEGLAVGDPVVIADQVVDFQFWVDCADSSGAIKDMEWGEDWSVPDGSPTSTGHACLAPSDPRPGLARIVHLRLSMRSARESPQLREVPFSSEQSGPVNMGTYDIDPNVQGKARVATVQTGFELQNFSIVGISPTLSSSP